MQFVVERNTFLKELSRVTGVIVSKTTIPILENVRIDAGAGGLLLRATDLDIEAEAPCAADVTAQGLTTVDGKLLADFVKRCPDGSQIAVTVEHDTGRMKLACGRTRGTVPVLPVDDFPTIENGKPGKAFLLPCAQLKRMLAQVKHAWATDEARSHLGGVYFHKHSDFIAAAAHDGYQLAVTQLALPAEASEMPHVTLPRKLVGELLRLLPSEGDAAIEVSEERVRVTLGEFRIMSVLMASRFPDFRQHLPLFSQFAFVNREALIGGIDRVRIVSDRLKPQIQLSFRPGEIGIAARGTGFAICQDAINAECPEGEMVIGLNGRYLLDILSALPGDRTCIAFSGPNAPLKLTNADDPDSHDFMVVAPMLDFVAIQEERQAA